MSSHKHGYPGSVPLRRHQYIASKKSTGTTYLKVQEKVGDGMADVRVGLTVSGIDDDTGIVTALVEGVMLDVPGSGTRELDAVPEAEPNPVVDREEAVLEGLLAQAAPVLFEKLSCLVVRSRRLRVPVDHDKLQSIVNLSSEKSDQALILFRASI